MRISDWSSDVCSSDLSSLAKELADTDSAVLFERHHMQLLNDPAVYTLIAKQLGVTKRTKRTKKRSPSPAGRKTARPPRAAKQRPRRRCTFARKPLARAGIGTRTGWDRSGQAEQQAVYSH